MQEVTLKVGAEDYEYLKLLEKRRKENINVLVQDLFHRFIIGEKEKTACNLFKEGKISILEACDMLKVTPSEMIGILIKNKVEIGSERLSPSDIGLRNLRESFGG